MKELEKTKRISIAAVITILVVIIALLSYKRPTHSYKISTRQMLENITGSGNFIHPDSLSTDMQVIDIRNAIEFEKGHLEHAINIYAPELLNDRNTELIQSLTSNGKTLVLYGRSPEQSIAPFMLLKQLGISDIKMLPLAIYYNQNALKTTIVPIEQNIYDIPGFIAESVKKAAVKPKPIIKYVEPPKKVIPKKKKKKMPIEGGC